MPKKFCKWSKCGAEFEPVRFNQKTCNNYMCALGHAKELTAKKEKLTNAKEKKEWLTKRKSMKQGLKTLSDLEKEAKKVFQSWIRKRDQRKPCVSCGCRLNKMNTHASHYFAAGQYSGYMFDETNCHSSCVQCNTWLHGNLINYRKGLIARYGQVYVDELEFCSQEKRNKKYTRDELISIKEKYNQKLREAEKQAA